MDDNSALDTLGELRVQLESLRQKKNELQQKLDDVKDKLSAVKGEEKRLQAGIKELLKAERKLDELMSEENMLGMAEKDLEEEMGSVKMQLDKAKALLERLG